MSTLCSSEVASRGSGPMAEVSAQLVSYDYDRITCKPGIQSGRALKGFDRRVPQTHRRFLFCRPEEVTLVKPGVVRRLCISNSTGRIASNTLEAPRLTHLLCASLLKRRIRCRAPQGGRHLLSSPTLRPDTCASGPRGPKGWRCQAVKPEAALRLPERSRFSPC